MRLTICKRLWQPVLVTGMLPLLVAIILMTHSGSEAQTYTFLAVDGNPEGSEPANPGAIDPCVEVSLGSSFDVDIQIREVANLLSWEAYFVYDPNALEVTSKNVKMFQAADPASNIIDGSEPLPDDDGRFLLAASETAHSADSGSGVLARITLRAKASGLVRTELPLIDVNGDGTPDLGPILTNSTGSKIGDLNGDNFFDGTAYGAQIAVGVPCPQSTPVPSPSPLPSTPTPTPTPPEPTLQPTPPPSSAPSTTSPNHGGPTASGATPLPSGASIATSATLRVTDDPTPTGHSGSGTKPDNRDEGGTGPDGRSSSSEGSSGGQSSGINFILITLIALATVTIGATMVGGFALYNRSRSRDTL